MGVLDVIGLKGGLEVKRVYKDARYNYNLFLGTQYIRQDRLGYIGWRSPEDAELVRGDVVACILVAMRLSVSVSVHGAANRQPVG